MFSGGRIATTGRAGGHQLARPVIDLLHGSGRPGWNAWRRASLVCEELSRAFADAQRSFGLVERFWVPVGGLQQR